MDRLRQDDPYRCIWEPSENRDFVLVVAVIGHYVPCAIMVGCYIKVSMTMRKRSKVSANRKAGAQLTSTAWSTSSRLVTRAQNAGEVSQSSTVFGVTQSTTSVPTTQGNTSSSSGRERRTFVTLTYILGSYLICWFPFYVTFDLYAWRSDLVPEGLYVFWFWMTYVNSTLNPVLYAFSSKDFKLAFKKVLLCKRSN